MLAGFLFGRDLLSVLLGHDESLRIEKVFTIRSDGRRGN
jgi:hypothetical protein